MKSYSLVVTALLLILLIFQFVHPVLSYVVKETYKAAAENFKERTVLPIPRDALVEQKTQTKVLEILGVKKRINITLTLYTIHINGTEFRKAKAISKLEGENDILIVETPMMQAQNKTEINGKDSLQTLTTYEPVRYSWEGVTFISTQSRPLYVRYDHCDNGPYPNPTYDIPVDEAESTKIRTTTGRLITHLPKHVVDNMKSGLAFGLAPVITDIVAILWGLPDLVGTKTAALILSAVDLILIGLGWVYNLWVDNIVKTEMGDGWQYTWGAGGWWIFKWCTISFGAWRDIGWPIFWISPGDPAGPQIGYLDSFLLIDTPGLEYIKLAGLGKDIYGTHSYQNSTVYAGCYVGDSNGNPLKGIKIEFSLTIPDSYSISLGSASTDENGMAFVGFTLNPDYAPAGIYRITGKVGSYEDTTAFSYKYTLLITGHTYDEKTVYIENYYLVTEGAIVQFTANPPYGYRLRRWIIDYYWVCYYYSFSLVMNDDHIVIASFMLRCRGGGGGGRYLLMM